MEGCQQQEEEWQLAYFASVHHEFRIPEIEAIAEITTNQIKIKQQDTDIKTSPFVKMKLPSQESACSIANRSVTLKGFYQIWGEGNNYEEVIEDVKKFVKQNSEFVSTCASPNSSFKFVVEAFGRKLQKKQQIEKMDMFKFLNFQGPITMNTPTNTFWILEDVGEHSDTSDPPKRIYFTREIARGRRDLIDIYNLKKRQYLGTTSMDSELSLISANQARVGPGSLMIDPFAGTGSFLITASHFGAMTIGGDIDIRVLRGKEPGKSVRGNFEQYQLQPFLLDLVRFDHAKNDVWRTIPIFDAIITDPPYGVRAGAKKVGLKRANLVRINDTELPEGWEPHITQTVPYSVPEVLSDLLDYAARNLRVGGFLVYWLPTSTDYKPSDVPDHPCLTLISNSEQPLNSKWRRRLITMKKLIEFDITQHEKTMVMHEREDVAHANFAMKRLNDPNRHDKRYQTPSPTCTTTSTTTTTTVTATTTTTTTIPDTEGQESSTEEKQERKKQKI